MAWPLTPFETDIANVTVVHASLATALQAAIQGLTAGSMTLKAAVIDGVGAVGYSTPSPTGTPTAGTLLISTGASGTVAPTTTVPHGTQYKESALFGWAASDSTGTFLQGLNVKSVSRTGLGQYTVTFNGAPANTTARLDPIITPGVHATGKYPLFQPATAASLDGGGNLQIFIAVEHQDRTMHLHQDRGRVEGHQVAVPG